MYSVSIIGSGNVAARLGHLFKKKKFDVAAVYSRNNSAVNALSSELKVPVVPQLKNLPQTDLTVLAVSDAAISDVATQLPVSSKTLVVHTSGIASLDVLIPHARRGVFYPLQSLSKNKETNWENVPVFIETTNRKDEQLLQAVAELLHLPCHILNYEQRQYVHLAAVFANNFTNRLYEISFEIAQLHNIDPTLLTPLIQETAAKIKCMSPHEAQTGPARRRDSATIEKHVDLLRQHSQYRQLYEIMSRSIIESLGLESA